MIFFGVLCEVAATMVGTAGKQLVSYSSRVDPKRARMFKVSGLVITTLVGPVLDMAAYAFAPQAIIAPLNALDIVWNTCSAPYTLGERLSSRHVLGTALVFVGAMLTSLFGPHHETEESLAWMQTTFLSWRFLSYVAVFGVCLAASFLTLRARPKGVGDKARGVALGLTAGGIAGNMYFISAGLGLLRSCAGTGDWSAWANWIPYPVLLGGVAVAVSNIPFMTKALQEYEALFAVTLFEGCHICVACVSGAWVLGEMDHEDPLKQSVYWLCILVIVTGLLVIQSAAAGSGKPARSDKAQLNSNSPADAQAVSWPGDGAPTAAQPPQLQAAPEQPAGPDEEQPDLAHRESAIVVWAGGASGIFSASLGARSLDLEDSEEGEESTDDDETTNGEGDNGDDEAGGIISDAA